MNIWDSHASISDMDIDELRHTFRELRERRREQGAQVFHFDFETTHFNHAWERANFDASITYDPKEKRYEVQLPWESSQSTRYFNTKRSALRFVKRWEAKQRGEKTKKVVSPMKMKKYQEKLDNDYLERLGI